MAGKSGLKDRIDRLYNGRDVAAQRFRFALVAFDAAVIVFFFITATMETSLWILIVDWVLAAILAADLGARFAITGRRSRFFLDPLNIADAVVVLSLLAAAIVESLAFLRVLRALRLLRSYHMMRELNRTFPFLRRNEQVVQSSINLIVFIFIVSAFVYAFQITVNQSIDSFLDALYFTVATLTTTGFGDIVLEGEIGRWLSILIMVVGVALFLRLAQTIFRPAKVKHRCPDCGLTQHDADAVHCKHCGRVINIETEGG